MNIPERILLGPGPSPVSARVMRALAQPVLSHLDPAMMAILDDVRQRLDGAFRAREGAFSFAVSGTGTSGMEAAVANTTKPGARALVVVSGYFGDRLAQMLDRYEASVTRLDVEWGRACDPAAVERALALSGADIVAVVHAETSTGVVNPVQEIVAIARAHDAITIVDAVTSLGAVPLDVGAWDVDACYSCTQKGLGAPSGLAPISFSARALERRAPSRSFSFDVGLLQDYWLRRRYHHTISAPLIYALREALVAVDEAAIRKALLQEFSIEIGAGLGPLAGKIWRIGLMGSGSTPENISRLTGALRTLIRR